MCVAPSQQESVQHTQYVVNLLTKLGWMINQQKSDLVPSQQITFLGMYIDLEAGFLAPTQEKIDKILLWSQFLHKSTVISVQQYLSLLGLLNNVSSLVKLGRLHLRPLQLYLASFGLDLRASLYDTIPLRPVFFTALMWWEHPEKLARGVELRTPPTQMTMFTDASRSGWGASILTHSAKGKWNHLDKQNHISAVRLGLQALQHLVTGKCIRVMSDNVATIAYIRNEGGTRSIPLYKETKILLLWCQDNNVIIVPTFLPGRRNVCADQLSRSSKVLATEWTLDKFIFRKIHQAVPHLSVNLFATRWNN